MESSRYTYLFPEYSVANITPSNERSSDIWQAAPESIMPFFQPTVTPLPADLDLQGQTIVVTGASSGLGLEFSRQFLVRNASTLILAVRNVEKGEAVRQSLLENAEIQRLNPNASIKVLQLDAESYQSIKDFTTQLKQQCPQLHILMLNAGARMMKHDITTDGHERSLQLNYLSNALLLFELLPLLEATATQIGHPTRVTVTGSRMYSSDTLSKKPAAEQVPEKVIRYFDSLESFSWVDRYGDTKLLVLLFIRQLASLCGPEKVIVNHFCPGMVQTSMANTLPWYIRGPVRVLAALRARNVEQGGWIALHAACVAGSETHGSLLGDKEIHE